MIEQSTHQVFYDKLTFLYLEMPRFDMTEEEVMKGTRFEKWIYLLKHLGQLDRVPGWVKEQVFLKLFDQAELAQLEPVDRESYEQRLKHYRDLNNVINTARSQALAEGIEQGIEKRDDEIRSKLKDKGWSETKIDDFLD